MRLSQMWSVAAAADGATSKHSAQGLPRDADGARRGADRAEGGRMGRGSWLSAPYLRCELPFLLFCVFLLVVWIQSWATYNT